MPRHDFRCTVHRAHVLRDVYRSIEEGGRSHPPTCPKCGAPMEWITPVPRMSLAGDGATEDRTTFRKFTTRDGRNQLVEIDSLAKLRQVERESEQLARDGEGQHITFRAFSQDGSNRDVNTHGEPPSGELTAEAKRKWGLRGATTACAEEPSGEYGPGVNDSNTSALPID